MSQIPIAKLKDFRSLVLLSIVHFVRILPSRWALARLAGFLSTVVWSTHRSRVRQSLTNLTSVFGDTISDSEKEVILKAALKNHWEEFLFLSCNISKGEVARIVKTEGFSNLLEALAEGNGAILWEANLFGFRNLAKHFLAEKGYPVVQLQSENHLLGNPTIFKNFVLYPSLRNLQSKFHKETIIIPQSNDSLVYTRRLFDRVKKNEIVAMGGLGNLSRRFTKLPFLGVTGLFATGAFTLSRMTGAPVFPVFCLRDRDGEFKIVFKNPINVRKDGTSGQSVDDALKSCVEMLEQLIHRYPDHFLQWHDFFWERNNPDW